MLDVTKFAVLSLVLVSVFVSQVVSITFPLRSGQQGNRMVTVDSDGKRFSLSSFLKLNKTKNPSE